MFHVSFGPDDPERQFAIQVAEKFGGRFHEVRVTPDRVAQVLDGIASDYDHPFVDFSTIPTCLMMREVGEVLGHGGGVMLDGIGADGCWGMGSGGSAAAVYRMRQVLGPLRPAVYDLARSLHRRFNYHLRPTNGKLAFILRWLCRGNQRTLTQSYFAQNWWEGSVYRFDRKDVQRANEAYDQSHAPLFIPGKNSFAADLALVDMAQIICRIFSAKVVRPGLQSGAFLEMPFQTMTCFDVATAFPWSSKVVGKMAKYPLKKLVASHLGNEFAYRPKSGFSTVRVFEAWSRQPEFRERLRTIIEPTSVWYPYFDKKLVLQMLDHLHAGGPIISSVATFLWGALFVDMWIRHYDGFAQPPPQ